MIRVATFDDSVKEYITQWEGEYVFVEKWVVKEFYDVSENLYSMLCLKFDNYFNPTLGFTTFDLYRRI